MKREIRTAIREEPIKAAQYLREEKKDYDPMLLGGTGP